MNRKWSKHVTPPGRSLFYLVAAIGIIIALILWYAFKLQANAHIRNIIELQSEHVASDIDTQFELRISALRSMTKHLEDDPHPDYRQWKNSVFEFVKDLDGIEGIALYAPTLQQIWLTRDANINTHEFFRQFIQAYGARIQNTSTSGTLWISPAMKISNSENGIFVVSPVMTRGVIRAYLITLMSIQTVLKNHINRNDYSITIFDSSGQIFESRTNNPPKKISPVATTTDLYGTPWKTYVLPSQRLLNEVETQLPLAVLLLGILIAFLVAIASQLAAVASSRAKSLVHINKDLKCEIADRQAAEKIKQKLERALLQGQKLQAIGTLAGGIAHDFNNLLYAIIGYAEMAQEDVPVDSITYKNLGRVLEASERGRDLISRILTFSRRSQFHSFAPLNLEECIQSALELLRPTVPASIDLDFTVKSTKPLFILGDSTRIHQIIVNLVNNAADAMDGEGTITITLNEASPKDKLLKEIIETETKNQKYCKIEFIDTGQGIDAALQERIFEPFFTTKEVGKGTGLGLATVHTIVKEHNGDIFVKSEMGHGATFTILLPLHEQQTSGD